MIPLDMIMSSKEDLVDKIAKILKAEGDLDFLTKLSPRELTALFSHLQVFLEQKV